MSDDGNYEWYLAGYDFLVDRWNFICRTESAQLMELPRVLERVRLLMTEAWDIKAGNPRKVGGEGAER